MRALPISVLVLVLNDPPARQPAIFWISGFFFTPSFSTASLQNFARRNKYAIDTVGFEMEMLNMDPEDYPDPPPTGRDFRASAETFSL